MSGSDDTASCPHCGTALVRLRLPDEAGWPGSFQLACFNDDCGYFRRGWSWMFDTVGVRASYRYRVDPASGQASPLPVWSRTALRDRILEDDVAVPGSAGDDVISESHSGNGGEK